MKNDVTIKELLKYLFEEMHEDESFDIEEFKKICNKDKFDCDDFTFNLLSVNSKSLITSPIYLEGKNILLTSTCLIIDYQKNESINNIISWNNLFQILKTNYEPLKIKVIGLYKSKEGDINLDDYDFGNSMNYASYMNQDEIEIFNLKNKLKDNLSERNLYDVDSIYIICLNVIKENQIFNLKFPIESIEEIESVLLYKIVNYKCNGDENYKKVEEFKKGILESLKLNSTIESISEEKNNIEINKEILLKYFHDKKIFDKQIENRISNNYINSLSLKGKDKNKYRLEVNFENDMYYVVNNNILLILFDKNLNINKNEQMLNEYLRHYNQKNTKVDIHKNNDVDQDEKNNSENVLEKNDKSENKSDDSEEEKEMFENDLFSYKIIKHKYFKSENEIELEIIKYKLLNEVFNNFDLVITNDDNNRFHNNFMNIMNDNGKLLALSELKNIQINTFIKLLYLLNEENLRTGQYLKFFSSEKYSTEKINNHVDEMCNLLKKYDNIEDIKIIINKAIEKNLEDQKENLEININILEHNILNKPLSWKTELAISNHKSQGEKE